VSLAHSRYQSYGWSFGLQAFRPHVTQARFPFKRTLRAMRALRKRKTQVTQALALATMIGCFDRAFLLAGAYVRWVKNRIGSIVAFSYAMTACVSCVTCACVLLFFFACVIFLRLLRFLRPFYFACVPFLTQGLACVACVACV